MTEFTQQQLKPQSGLLETMICAGYYQDVAAKSATRIGVLSKELAQTHAHACFFVCITCTHAFIAVWSSDLLGDNLQIMAVRVGTSSEVPVSSSTGYANPARAATQLRLASLGGRYNALELEDATMASTPTIALPKIQVINGIPVSSSLAVSDYFHRHHKDVLRKIENLECSSDFTERNFTLSEYSDTTGRKQPCYFITRDGFTFLAMGFTGKRAAAFKEAYINAFNQMEEKIRQQAAIQLCLPHLNDQVQTANDLVYLLRQLRDLANDKVCPALTKLDSPHAPHLFSLANEAVIHAQLLAMRLSK